MIQERRFPQKVPGRGEERRMDKLRDLFLRYYRAVVAYFLRQGCSLEEARDLAQDVFVRVYKGWTDYRGESEWNFLMKTAHHVWLNELRWWGAKKRGEEIPLPPSLTESMARNPLTNEAPSTQEEELIEQEEAEERRRRSQWLRDAILKLPENLQRCLRHWLGGLKLREIAVVEGITLDAVKSRLNAARHLLRDDLEQEPEGLDWPEVPQEDDRDEQD